MSLTLTSGSAIPAVTSSVTSVDSSITSVQLLPINLERKALTIYNDSTKDLYIKLGEMASLTSFTVLMPSRSYYELTLPAYTGQIDGIWDGTNGSARLTELI